MKWIAHLGKSGGLLRPGASVSSRYEFIDAEKARYPVVKMCVSVRPAGRRHRCRRNKKHLMLMGEGVLVVKEGRRWFSRARRVVFVWLDALLAWLVVSASVHRTGLRSARRLPSRLRPPQVDARSVLR